MDAILTVRLDKGIKEKATKTLENKGMTPSLVVQQLFDFIVRTGDVPFGSGVSRPSPEELNRRLHAMNRFEVDAPLMMTDLEIKAARIKEKHDIDVG